MNAPSLALLDVTVDYGTDDALSSAGNSGSGCGGGNSGSSSNGGGGGGCHVVLPE